MMTADNEEHIIDATPHEEVIPKKKKRGIFGILRRKKKTEENREQSPVIPEAKTESREGNEQLDDTHTINSVGSAEEKEVAKPFRTVRFPVHDAQKWHKYKPQEVVLTKPPTALESAFGGPPRYDWIDIETAAAIKVQSVYRRNKAMTELEKEGVSTAYIRNRTRRRQARLNSNGITGSADIPNLFACCGIGLAFGEATEEDYEASRQHEREQLLARRKEREEKEEALRKQYRKAAAKKAAERGTDVEECYEVVDEDVEV